MTSHTRKWKEKQLEELKALIENNKIIAIASIDGMPASMLQQIKNKLSGDVTIKVSKVRVIKRALAESRYGKFDWAKYARGQVALVATNMGPFELYSALKKNMARAYLTAGSIADRDIVVPAGDTNLAPGPDLSLLKAANIPVAMKGNTIQILKDTVVVHKGEQVTQEVANALLKLDIRPREIMLKVLAASDGNIIYEPSVLDIDLDKFRQDLQSCHANAFNLAFSIGYVTPQNIKLFLQKGFREAKALAREAGIILPETLPELIAKAQAEASAISAFVKLEKPTPEQPEAQESQ